jgi:hypothetical protein
MRYFENIISTTGNRKILLVSYIKFVCPGGLCDAYGLSLMTRHFYLKMTFEQPIFLSNHYLFSRNVYIFRGNTLAFFVKIHHGSRKYGDVQTTGFCLFVEIGLSH